MGKANRRITLHLILPAFELEMLERAVAAVGAPSRNLLIHAAVDELFRRPPPMRQFAKLHLYLDMRRETYDRLTQHARRLNTTKPTLLRYALKNFEETYGEVEPRENSREPPSPYQRRRTHGATPPIVT